MLTSTLLGASTPPAGGAAISDVIYATAGAMVVTVVLFGPILLYKLGRFPALGRLADMDEKATKLPGWAALPGSFLGDRAADRRLRDVLGHLPAHRPGPRPGAARQPRPLLHPRRALLRASPPACSGSRFRTSRRGPRSSWRPAGHAPIGGLMIAICGASSLLAFPLDDIWHRIFGQDVTLWGPTHLMLIGGASLSVLGAWALHVEGDEERKAARRPAPLLDPAPRGHPRRRLPGRALDLPGRVRLRRAAVRARPAADADHARRRDRAGRRSDPNRPRRRARRGWRSTSRSAAS